MTADIEKVSEAYGNALAIRAELDNKYLTERESIDAKIDKLQSWLWEHSEHTANTLVKEFVDFRDARAELKKQYEINDSRYREYMDLREAKLLEMLNTMGGESIRTTHGTAYVQVKERFNCKDWPAYWHFMKLHDRMDLLEKRPAQGALAKMKEEGTELPPGLDVHSERVVTVRRS